MKSTFQEALGDIPSVWERLSNTQKPIVLYGMGLGAEKILRVLEDTGVSISAVFASDKFVRGHSFHGFRVLTLSELTERFSDPLVVISFGSHRPEVLEQMRRLAARFETVAPDVPVAGELLFTPALLKEQEKQWENVYALLEDGQSRKAFLEVARFKLSGDISYLFRCETPREDVWHSLICPGPQEVFVDLGAYNGDTVREFLLHTGGQCRTIVALEPDAHSFRRLTAFAQTPPYDQLDIRCHNAGAWDRREQLIFRRQAGRNSAISFFDPPGLEHRSVKQIPVQMEAMDLLLEGTIPTIIKLDVEGAEYQALEGCAETICKYRPKLMVSAYHRSDDLIRLPLLIRRLRPDYRIFLRHHPYVPAWETNFYCV